MNMLNNRVIGLAVSAAIAISTVLARESLWHLGGTYWLVLGLLALVHVVVSAAIFLAQPGKLSIRLGAAGLLFFGQWWAIQMLAMQVIWRIKGFAP